MVEVTPQQGSFPPDGPVTLSQTIPSYLYKQYDDDADLQAFVASFNALAQIYTDWFTDTSLPVYTGLSGQLLDWVARGLYGITRPILSSGRFSSVGPLNTYALNAWPLDKLRLVGPKNIANTSDDIFQRILTWNFYKGDGTRFNIRWLKRRIMRFLVGANGSAPNIGETYAVSLTFGANGLVSIRLSTVVRAITGGAIFGRFALNQFVPYNEMTTVQLPGPNVLPNEDILKEAIDSGVLQLPFQFSWSITIPH